jgi:hypothetical protein
VLACTRIRAPTSFAKSSKTTIAWRTPLKASADVSTLVRSFFRVSINRPVTESTRLACGRELRGKMLMMHRIKTGSGTAWLAHNGKGTSPFYVLRLSYTASIPRRQHPGPQECNEGKRDTQDDGAQRIPDLRPQAFLRIQHPRPHAFQTSNILDRSENMPIKQIPIKIMLIKIIPIKMMPMTNIPIAVRQRDAESCCTNDKW